MRRSRQRQAGPRAGAPGHRCERGRSSRDRRRRFPAARGRPAARRSVDGIRGPPLDERRRAHRGRLRNRALPRRRAREEAGEQRQVARLLGQLFDERQRPEHGEQHPAGSQPPPPSAPPGRLVVPARAIPARPSAATHTTPTGGTSPTCDCARNDPTPTSGTIAAARPAATAAPSQTNRSAGRAISTGVPEAGKSVGRAQQPQRQRRGDSDRGDRLRSARHQAQQSGDGEEISDRRAGVQRLRVLSGEHVERRQQLEHQWARMVPVETASTGPSPHPPRVTWRTKSPRPLRRRWPSHAAAAGGIGRGRGSRHGQRRRVHQHPAHNQAFASFQFSPIPTSTVSGTLSATAPSICARARSPRPRRPRPARASNSSSSCTVRIMRGAVAASVDERRVEVDHRALEDVGGGALDRHVHRDALGRRSHHAVAVVDVRAPARRRPNSVVTTPGLARVGDGAVEEAAHARGSRRSRRR